MNKNIFSQASVASAAASAAVYCAVITTTLVAIGFAAHADENGNIVGLPQDCSGSKYTSIQNICKLVDTLGVSCTVTADKCVSASQELFTGNVIELASPTNIKTWNGMGGLGARYAAATTCLMRDTADLPEKKIKTNATATTLLGNVTAEQEVGFLAFNKANGVYEGYHRMKACGPVVGCIDAYTQKFKLTPVKTNKKGSGANVGQYEILEAHALDFWAEGLAQSIKVMLPGVMVPTPVGPMSVQPEFRFGRATGFITAPYDGNSKSSLPDSGLGLAANKTFDIYGRNPGTTASGLSPIDNTSGGGWAYNPKGWMSQIALGSRDSNPKNPVWAQPAGVEFPSRPDADIKKARSKIEKIPNAYLGASIEAKYDITNLIPSAILKMGCSGFVKICLEDASVFVRPTIDVGYTSQINFAENEQAAWNKKLLPGNIAATPDLRPANLDQAKTVGIFAASSAAARFALDAGLDFAIRLKINGLFAKINKLIVNIHPRTTIAEKIDTGYSSKPVIAGAHSQASKIMTDKKLFQQYLTLKGVNEAAKPGIDGGMQHIKMCFAKDSETAPMPPEPTYTPGNPEDLVELIEYPCNICVGWDDIAYQDDENKPQIEKGQVGVILPAPQDGFAPADKWNCKRAVQSGCYDMCSMEASGKLKVLRTAIQMIKSGEAKDMPKVCQRAGL